MSRKWSKLPSGAYVVGSYADYINEVIAKEKIKEWWLDVDPNKNKSIGIKDVGDSFLTYTSLSGGEGDVTLPSGAYEHQGGGYPNPEMLVPINTRSDVFYNFRNSLSGVIKDVESFVAKKDVYKKLQVHYKRGYLLYGPPGNGKTGVIRNLCNSVFSDAHVIWLKRMPSTEMLEELAASPKLKVFIIEEISAEHNRNYVQDILSFLDGETSIDNSIVIGTTNYPEDLQKNLADRPGRFDLMVEIPNLNQTEAAELFQKFLGRPLQPNEVKLKDLSIAYVKHICLEHLVNNKPLQEVYEEIEYRKKNIKNMFVDKPKLGI